MPIHGLIFDFGGVLFSIRRDIALRLEQDNKLDSGILYNTLFDCWRMREPEEAQRRLEAAAGRSLPPLFDIWRKSWGLIDENISLIRSLKGKYRVAILSNASRYLEVRLHEFGIYDLFDAVVISDVVGLSKPDPKIYHLVTERLSLSPEQCLMIDDTETNINAARELGMAALYYRAEMGDDLRSLLTGINIHVD